MFKFRPITKMKSGSALSVAFAASIWLLLPTTVFAKNALIETPLGDIEIELLEEDAPKTVANFLNYVNNGRYEKTFIHRNVADFIIQGGGFIFDADAISAVSKFPAVENEFKVSNTKGTLAMAKLDGDPNSATSSWFINLEDNSENLDNQNGGFTVFAKVVSGLDVAVAISELTTWDATSVLGGAFGTLPLINFPNDGSPITDEHMVFTTISEIPEVDPFVMNAGLNDAWFYPETDGQGFFVTIFPDLKYASIAWFTFDTELPAGDETANLGDPGHRWITAIGPYEGNSAVMDITITSGGIFDTATEVQNTDPVGSDGTITLTFDNCETGLVEYDITSINRQGSVPIVRVAADNTVMCEMLAEPAAN